MQRPSLLLITLTSLAIGLIDARLQAQAFCRNYDADLGSAPHDQSWERTLTGSNTSLYFVGDVLALDTMPLSTSDCTTASDPKTFRWHIDDKSFSFDDVVVFEVEMRVIGAQKVADPCKGWTRAGFTVELRDRRARNIHLGFGESHVYLLNDPYLTFGSDGIQEISFDTTDDLHRYRLEVDGAGAVLFIDDVPWLSVPHGPPSGLPNYVGIGDQSIWANCEVEVASFRVASHQGADEWTNLGHSLPGSRGSPCLAGETWSSGNIVALRLDNALDGAPVYWLYGYGRLDVPFKGGILVPDSSPPGYVIPTIVGGVGFGFVTPPGIPSGFTFYWQCWIVDPDGPFGYAASNAMSMTVP